MALDRWIALVLFLLCIVYGYAAWFTMDGLLPPFMQRNPIWPSTFPKVLAVLGALAALSVLLNLEKSDHSAEAAEINYRRLTDYKLGQALILLGLMVAYALLLRPLGFLAATTLFLFIGGWVLGERRYLILVPVALAAAGTVWWLVDRVLGIFLSPLPAFF